MDFLYVDLCQKNSRAPMVGGLRAHSKMACFGKKCYLNCSLFNYVSFWSMVLSNTFTSYGDVSGF